MREKSHFGFHPSQDVGADQLGTPSAAGAPVGGVRTEASAGVLGIGQAQAVSPECGASGLSLPSIGKDDVNQNAFQLVSQYHAFQPVSQYHTLHQVV